MSVTFAEFPRWKRTKAKHRLDGLEEWLQGIHSFSPTGEKEEILSLNSMQHLRVSAGLANVQCNKLSQLLKRQSRVPLVSQSSWCKNALRWLRARTSATNNFHSIRIQGLCPSCRVLLDVSSVSLKESLDIKRKSWTTLKRQRNHI